MEIEIQNLISWIEGHRNELASYFPEQEITHKAIWGSRVMDNLTKDIKNGNKEAINLGCELIAKDQKYAFGKIIKSNLARALKNNAETINSQNQKSIVNITKKLLSMDHTPRETEDYCHLIVKFKGVNLAEELKTFKAGCKSAERWLQYLNEKSLTNASTPTGAKDAPAG
jgi:hypothetical protein